MAGYDDDEGGGPAGGRDADRRHRLANEAMVAQRLEDIQRSQRELRREFEEMRKGVNDNVKSAVEGALLIRHLDGRISEMLGRLAAVEATGVRREEFEKALAPFRKGAAWAATLVIGMVLTAVLSLVINKGGGGPH